ncbi:MAG: hypothetical protein ACX93T_04250 [Bacteroidota bacterium]
MRSSGQLSTMELRMLDEALRQVLALS